MWDEDFQVYGVRKVWRRLRREGVEAARCTVGRLMRAMGLRGIVRGETVRTTIGDRAAPCPPDRVNRDSEAPRPNALWVADFTCVPTRTGFVRVAFVIDALAGRIVGRRVSRTAAAGFALDALERSSRARRPVAGGLVHHSGRGVRYVSITYTERLAGAGIAPSVGGVGDRYDDALAETVIGLFRAEVIRRRGPRRSPEAVESATLDRVDRFNRRRLLEPIGFVPPAEAAFFAELEDPPLAASGSNQPASGRPGAVHGEKKRQVGEAVPYGRMGRPEDHAGAAVFLACPDSDYVVAQTLNADGGNWMS